MNQLYAVRLFVGVSEAVSFPGSYVIMGTCYTPPELIRRTGFYNLMASVDTVTSGLFQTACREHLDGIMGKPGWRWQFIIDGAITLACTSWGFFLFPGTPETTKKFGFLTEDDLVFARNRMPDKVALPTKFGKENILLSDLAPTFYAWAATLYRDSAEKKQITLALMNTVSYATQIWKVPFQWNTKYSPRFSTGFQIKPIMILIINLAFVAASVLETCNDHITSKIAGQQKHDDSLLSSKDNSHSTLYEEEEVPPSRSRSVFGSQGLKTYGAIGGVSK